MYLIGRNKHGEFGSTDKKNISKWTAYNDIISNNIIKVVCGNGYNLFVDNSNNYFAAGNNSHGECGIENTDKLITQISSIEYFQHQKINIKNIFATITGSVTFWLTQHNQIYGSGWNNHSQLGNKMTVLNKFKAPILLNNLMDLKINIKDIQSAFNYSLCLSSNGEVYSTPFSKHGGHGHGTARNHKTWIQIKTLNRKNIIRIETGYYHSLFLEQNGILWCCGKNSNGQLGRITQNKNKNKLITFPSKINYFTQKKIKIKEIKCGGNHNLVVSVKNKLFVFGANTNGQCGDGTTNDIYKPKLIFLRANVKNIGCGRNHSYVCTSDNKHFLFGNNYWNQCIPCNNKQNKKIVHTPYLINKDFADKKIKEVYLGYDSTIVMTEEHKIHYDNDEKKIEQNDDEKKEKFELKQALRIINDEIVKVKQKYQKSALKNIMKDNFDDIVNKDSNLNKTLLLYTVTINDVIKTANELNECIQNTRDQINELGQPNPSNYKNWSIPEILIWIKSLENGRFIQYMNKLEKGLIECEATGDVLPDIDKNELVNKYFDIKSIKIRRDLANHFKDLEKQIGKNEANTDEGNVTNFIE